MAAEHGSEPFRKLAIKKLPKAPTRITEEDKFWRRYKSATTIREQGAITSIHFSQSAPYDFAVTAGTRVQVYGSATNVVKKTISRFKDVALGSAIRKDGKVLASGDSSGLVQLFDLSSRAILRTFRGHDKPTHVVRFLPSQNTQLLTASDDKTVKLWDIPTETSLTTFSEHKDYIRSCIVCEDNNNLILTSSYDHTVKLWDLRTQKSSMTMNHGHPVEAIVMFPNGGVAVSAGSNVMRVWDLFGGGNRIRGVMNHQKTITSLAFDSSRTRLLSGGLDQHVKVYDVVDYKVTYSTKFQAPILSMAVSPDDSRLVVGMSTGVLSIRQKEQTAEDAFGIAPQAAGSKYVTRTPTYKARQDDLQVESLRRAKLKDYDKFLKSFQYTSALDAVLGSNRSPVIIVSLLEELIYRDGLRTALAGRDDASLEPLLRFLMKHLPNPRYTKLLVEIVNVVLEMYGGVIAQSSLLEDLMRKISDKVQEELRLEQDLQEIMGIFELISSHA